jgi:hypothetical protein
MGIGEPVRVAVVEGDKAVTRAIGSRLGRRKRKTTNTKRPATPEPFFANPPWPPSSQPLDLTFLGLPTLQLQYVLQPASPPGWKDRTRSPQNGGDDVQRSLIPLQIDQSPLEGLVTSDVTSRISGRDICPPLGLRSDPIRKDHTKGTSREGGSRS